MIGVLRFARPRAVVTVLALGLGMSGAMVPGTGLAQTQANAGIVFSGAAPEIEFSNDRLDLVLRFAQPVTAETVADLQARFAGLVEFVSAGYDQILVRGRQPLAYQLTAVPGGHRLELAVSAAGAIQPATDAVPADLRRGLTLARLEIQRGQIGQATMRLDGLTARYGERADILALRAELAETRGAWRQAADTFRRASALDRDNEFYADAARRTDRMGAPLVRAESDVAIVKNGDRQHSTVLRAQGPVGAMTDVGAIIENRQLDTATALRLDGSSQPAHIDRQRVELYASHTFEAGGALRGALLASSEGNPGAAIAYSWRDAREETRVAATYGRPYWELVSGIVNDGRQDSLEVQHDRQLGDGWSGVLGLRYNRYGVDGDNDVTRSAGLTAGLRKALPLGGLDASVGYGLDGEYIHSQQIYRGSDGAPFRPLDIGTREIHSLDVAIAETFAEWLRVDLYGGYAYDRYNKGAPFLGGSLTVIGTEQFEAGLRASRAKALTRGSSDDVTRAGAYAQWRF